MELPQPGLHVGVLPGLHHARLSRRFHRLSMRIGYGAFGLGEHDATGPAIGVKNAGEIILPPIARPARTALRAAHFDRNKYLLFRGRDTG